MSSSAIAIVGMGARLPGAQNAEQYWRNLRDGIESVRFFTEEELLAAGVEPGVVRDPNYVRAGVVLEQFDEFDAGFFGFSPKDAAIMDPQHRVFLECAWEALENSGHSPDRFPGAIGVFGGCGMNAYFMYNILTNRRLMDSVGLFLLRHTGNDKDFLVTRVSYQFNLHGPSVNVQTACSTSLVAVHLACQSLLSGECDMALAGGVTIEMPHYRGYMYQDGEILSRDGHCRAFDHRSTGTIFGSGAGMVVLRRLDDAIEDGDTIYAVVKGSAVNNDGKMKVGYLAPSVDGQAKAISEALTIADVSADTIGFVATHGTGTAVGDPIEISALTQAYRGSTKAKQFCAIGSVKTNIGHLDTAAGVASLIETVQVLRYKQIPPSLHYEAANPLIDFENSPFFVNTELRDWQTNGIPRRAGVSSLGVGGTNAHVILEEAPEAERGSKSRPWQLLCLSARSTEALDAATDRLLSHFKDNPGLELPDVAFTLQTGRQAFTHRRVLSARSIEDAIAALEKRDTQRLVTHTVAPSEPSIVFLFPGGGAQYPNMGRELYETEAVYRQEVDRCLAIARPLFGSDIGKLMFPPAGERAAAAEQLEHPANSVLSIFITEYALAKLWMSWGIRPAAMTGHSLGEYTAACLAGVMSLEDAIAIIVKRGDVFERMPSGAMLNVLMDAADVRSIVGDALSFAAVNTPGTCVLSGPAEAIGAAEQALTARGIECAKLRISVAAHSSMLDPFLDEFGAAAAKMKLKPPSIPLLSNLTGTWVQPDDLTNPQYWVKHLRSTVRFADGVTELLEESSRVLLEVGPGTTLSSLVSQHPNRKPAHRVVSSLRHPKDTSSDLQFLLTSLGRLWLAGCDIDWTKFRGAEKRKRIALPTYPFEHKRYWIEPGKATYSSEPAATPPEPQIELLKKLGSVDEWTVRPVWKKTPLPAAPKPAERKTWLIFFDKAGAGQRIAERLEQAGQDTVVVSAGSSFQALSETVYTVNPGERGDYESLLASLIEAGKPPQHIVHLWSVIDESEGESPNLSRTLDLSFYSLVYLVQSLAAEDLAGALEINIVSNGLRPVDEDEEVFKPERAVLSGPCKVIPQEFPGVLCRNIDLPCWFASSGSKEWLDGLFDELTSPVTETAVGYRRGERFTETFEPLHLEPAHTPSARLKTGGVYVFTGGLGGIALTQAQALAREYRAKLVLISRSGLPAPDERTAWVERHSEKDLVSRRIRQVEAIEKAGGEVLVLEADVTNAAQMRTAIETARERWGSIDGVFHTAGVVDDGLIQTKTKEHAAHVFAPKIHGTLALEAALAGITPDFVVLFSSTSALLGLVGQVDYTAANAFLDAYAASKKKNTTYTVALNWGVWQQVGMAAQAMDCTGPREKHRSLGRPVDHPLLQRCVLETPDRIIFEAEYTAESLWVLNEHRLRGGQVLLPGTGYIEIASAAFAAATGAPAMAIRDLFFLAPMEVGTGETKRVFVSLFREGESYSVAIKTETPDGGEQEHARAEVSALTTGAEAKSLEQIRTRCGDRIVECQPGTEVNRQEEHLDFGPRWENLRRIGYGKSEALAELELPAEFEADLAAYAFHPALLDMATGFALPLVAGYADCTDLFVPMSYGRICFPRRLTSKLFSHVRLNSDSLQNGIASFDVTLLDSDGAVLAEITDFAVRQIGRGAAFAASSEGKPADPAPKPRTPSAEQAALQSWIREGILPDEGWQVLSRVLAGTSGPQVIASSLDFRKLHAQTRPKPPKAAKGAERTSAAADASLDPIEKALVDLWQELLGLDSVGPNDDFFELGGHSLIAVRLFTKLKKMYKVDLGLATLFEARTVKLLAEVLKKHGAAAGSTPARWSALVPMRQVAGVPPLFCVHGVGGNILGYSDLVRALPANVTLIAIQSQGLNRDEQPLMTIEEIAEYYVREIKTVQPAGPYYLSGFSFGGVVAYEMAQQLHAAGDEIALLVMFDSDRPNLVLPVADRLKLQAEYIWKLPFDQKIDYSRRKVERILVRNKLMKPRPAAGPTAVDSAAGAFKTVRKNNFIAHRAYHAKPYPGKVVLFRASEVGESGIRTEDLGWAGLVGGGLHIEWVPGTHVNILYEPNVRVAVNKLVEYLELARQEHGSGRLLANTVTAS